jgi:hypothetical protein
MSALAAPAAPAASGKTLYPLRPVRWAFVALFGAIMADLAETLVDPANSGATATVFAAADRHGTRMLASAVLLLLTALIVPAVWGLTRPLVRRGRVLARISACLALLGALGHAALSMLYLVWLQVPRGDADREQMLALLDRINTSGSTAIVFPLLIAFPLSILALFAALVRAGVASRLVLAPVGAALVCAIAVPGAIPSTGGALVLLLLAASWVVVSLRAAQAPTRTPARRPAPGHAAAAS